MTVEATSLADLLANPSGEPPLAAAPEYYTRAQMIDLLLELPDTVPRHMLAPLSTFTLAYGLQTRARLESVRVRAATTRALADMMPDNSTDEVSIAPASVTEAPIAPGAELAALALGPAPAYAPPFASLDEAMQWAHVLSADQRERMQAHMSTGMTYMLALYVVAPGGSYIEARAAATRAWETLTGNVLPTTASASVTEAPATPADETDTHTCDSCGEECESVVPAGHFSGNRFVTDSEYCESCADERDGIRRSNYVCQTSSQRSNAPRDAWYLDEAYLIYCEDSEEWYTQAAAEHNLCYHESDSAWHAEPEESDDDDGSACYDYSADVLRVIGWPSETPADALCYGVELEVEASDDAGSLSQALGGRTGERHILKHDGSLSDGVEIVTQPFTLDAHRNTFGWAALLKSAQGNGNSHNTRTCGMHVHINRRALKPLQLGKMLVFMNAPGNVHYIKQIAQRDPSQWAAFKTKTLADGEKLSKSRYEAINVTHKTAEVRIFRGNLRLDRVMKNLEFCDALVNYCARARASRLTWRHFTVWLAKTTREYPNLRAFIAEHVTAPDVEETELPAVEQTDEESEASPYNEPATDEEI